jgi:hypothetical protein
MTKSLLQYSQWFRCYYANALKYCSSSSFKMYVESWDHSERDEDLVKLFWTSDQELSRLQAWNNERNTQNPFLNTAVDTTNHCFQRSLRH